MFHIPANGKYYFYIKKYKKEPEININGHLNNTRSTKTNVHGLKNKNKIPVWNREMIIYTVNNNYESKEYFVLSTIKDHTMMKKGREEMFYLATHSTQSKIFFQINFKVIHNV